MAKDLYKGSTKINTIYHGGTQVKKVYKGSTQIYQWIEHGKVLLEKSTAGTYSVTVPYDCTIQLHLVGGGAGGASVYFRQKVGDNYHVLRYATGGGSGGYVHGTKNVTAGTYSVTVGAGGTKGQTGTSTTTHTATGGAGGNSTAFGQTAKGAGSHDQSTAGPAGGYTIQSGLTTMSGANGNAGEKKNASGSGTITAAGGSSKYSGKGAGGSATSTTGNATANNGGAGYVKVTIV